ncbi:hypothetical protein Q0N88_33135 [Bacillus thuringiensis]|uniref:hypothetical protein n=1 Tax=Bacillus thuringiensis TaxID=1428 RepID=UPI0034599CC6
MSKLTMKAIRVHQYGSTDVLQLEKTVRPNPKKLFRIYGIICTKKDIFYDT